MSKFLSDKNLKIIAHFVMLSLFVELIICCILGDAFRRSD